MFITDNFLLETEQAQYLYKNFAQKMPIIDYHNHLDIKKIAEDYPCRSITELWLGGDHYKWRALRANGVDERYITGNASDYEKFEKWAETVPYTMRNPLYHWTHLELSRYFGIDDVLNKNTAEKIYKTCNDCLASDKYSTRSLLKMMNVETLCTTDDPVDSLEYHKQVAESGFEIKVLPAWRPDKLMAVENLDTYLQYIQRLAEVSNIDICDFNTLIKAIENRQDFFEKRGCKVSDHGLGELIFCDFTEFELQNIFQKILQKKALTEGEQMTFKSGMLYHLAVMNYKKGWVQQFHIGAIRNNNLRLWNTYGPDAGADSIHDKPVAQAMSRLLGKLDGENQLAKTIFYNLNPKDSDMMVAMLQNFNDGKTAGKMQYGAAWWFLDNMDGIQKQLQALSNGGLLSRFVGMLTDSRSFISFPRHEYFRRILCNMLGNDLKKGHLPESEMEFIGQIVSNICYGNAKQYFNF